MKQVAVQSTVIDWQAETLEITDRDGSKHIVPLDDIIHVTMEGEKEKHVKAGVIGCSATFGERKVIAREMIEKGVCDG